MLKKLRKMLKKQEGFTLVELMIVVVILGILAGIGVQQYVNVQERAKGAAHNANLRIISSAANMYVMLEGSAPGSVADLADEGYLQEVPVNPFGQDKVDGKPWVGSYGLEVSEPDDGGTYVITVTPDPYPLQGTSEQGGNEGGGGED
ncbi:competence type IV pilus major pilin ComGC [Candidatus Darwinibacter acetoxidans]